MICAEAKLKLEPCVSGTLTPEDRIALEEHLAICEGCRLELELTRAVMGAPSFEGADEPSPAPPEATAPEAPSAAPEPPAATHEHGEARPSTPLFDEISFANLEPEASAAGAPAGAPPAAGENPPDASAADPFANFTPKPEEPAEQSSANWDFEPAEVPRDSAPPEGSLSFANEALKRKREVDEKRKATLVRLALWGGGIGCGLVLLGVSVWIALAFRQEKAPEFGPDGVTTPQTETTTPAPPDSTATPSVSDGSAPPAPVTTQPTASAPGQPTTPAPTTSAPPQPAPDAQAPAPSTPTLLNATPGVAPSPGPPPPDASKSGSHVSKAKPKPGTKTTAKPAAGSGDDELFPWKPVDDVPTTPSRITRKPSIQQAPDAGAPKPAPTEPAPPAQAAPSTPPEAAPSEQGAPPLGGTIGPSTGAPASPAPQPPAEPAPPDPASMKPIDRLHLATLTAAKDADLVALRKLKSSWKSLVGSASGPDRTRAKLEYADCLWSIQEISGRNSDRRDALTAYRDYVLYAPAGGTNSRTVGRMRYLEDILTDR